MEYLIGITTAVLACLGAFKLFNDVFELGYLKYKEYDPQKRSFIILLTSVIAGWYIAQKSIRGSNNRKNILNDLYDLQVQLYQLEGILFSAVVVYSLSKNELNDPLQSNIHKYIKKVKNAIEKLLTKMVGKIQSKNNDKKKFTAEYKKYIKKEQIDVIKSNMDQLVNLESVFSEDKEVPEKPDVIKANIDQLVKLEPVFSKDKEVPEKSDVIFDFLDVTGNIKTEIQKIIFSIKK